MDVACFEWILASIPGGVPVSALHQWSSRHSRDGRDEMRTGGGLSFTKEQSSLQICKRSAHLTVCGYAFTTGSPAFSAGFAPFPEHESLTPTYTSDLTHKPKSTKVADRRRKPN